MESQLITSETLNIVLYVFLFIVFIASLVYLAAITIDLYDHLYENYPDPMKIEKDQDDDSDLGIFMS